MLPHDLFDPGHDRRAHTDTVHHQPALPDLGLQMRRSQTAAAINIPQHPSPPRDQGADLFCCNRARF